MRTYHRIGQVAVGAVILLFVLNGSLIGLPAFAQQQNGNLYDRSKRNGGKLVERFREERSVVYPNVEELAKRSTGVVIGRTIENKSRLTTDGNSVTTDFSVAVQEVLKGDFRPGSVVLVSIPGGAHKFGDGTTAFLFPYNRRFSSNDKTYVFFLDRKGPVSRGYELTGGAQGQFELDFASGTVTPADTAGADPVVRQSKALSVRDFLAEIHRVCTTGRRGKN